MLFCCLTAGFIFHVFFIIGPQAIFILPWDWDFDDTLYVKILFAGVFIMVMSVITVFVFTFLSLTAIYGKFEFCIGSKSRSFFGIGRLE